MCVCGVCVREVWCVWCVCVSERESVCVCLLVREFCVVCRGVCVCVCCV